MTDVVRMDAKEPDVEGIQRAADILRRGGLVAFPTETVYGLGAVALDRNAVRRIFTAKGRPANDPLIVHIHDAGQLRLLAADMPMKALDLAQRFWPGPLTMVFRRTSIVPDEVTAGLDTVAIRMPAHAIARALIDAAGVPVAAPSANLFSRPSPTRAEHVSQDLNGRIDLIIDGGPTSVGIESTVLDLTADVPVVLRPGAVTIDMLREALPRVQSGHQTTAGPGALKSPGLQEKHYSPKAALTLYEGERTGMLARIAEDATMAMERGQRVGIVIADEDTAATAPGSLTIRVGRETDLDAVAANLYSALRSLDDAGVDLILIRSFPGDAGGLGAAIHDRMRRAAAGRIVRTPA